MKLISHIGVYALLIDEKQEKVLLIKKARGPYIGKLDLPGGGLEPDELIEEALSREVLEETSCTLTSAQQIKTVSIRYEYPDRITGENCTFRHIGILFSGHIVGTPSEKSDGQDSNGAYWIDIADIAQHNVTPFVTLALDLHSNKIK